MEYTGKIRIFKAEDRERAAGTLSANGYLVWQGKEKVKKSYQYYIYYLDRKEETEGES